MPITKTSGIIRNKKMNLDYRKEFISDEIAQLFNDVEGFLVRKDAMVEAIRYMYLNTSNNN